MKEIKLKIYIGVDPGNSSGAMTYLWLQPDGETTILSSQFKNLTEKDIYGILNKFREKDYEICKAVIEKVHSYPGQGVSSSFKFGQNYGFLRGLLIALKIPFDEVSPQKWMKFYGMKKDKGETKSSWKKRLRQKAEQLFPKAKINNTTADSVLIAYYCSKNY